MDATVTLADGGDWRPRWSRSFRPRRAPGAQLSPSTNFISWLTGNFPDNYTLSRFGINGTDVGIIWDNGMVDDPSTPYNEHQLLIAFGDTFGDPNALASSGGPTSRCAPRIWCCPTGCPSPTAP